MGSRRAAGWLPAPRASCSPIRGEGDMRTATSIPDTAQRMLVSSIMGNIPRYSHSTQTSEFTEETAQSKPMSVPLLYIYTIIYTYTYIHICIYTCTYIHMHTCTLTYTHIYKYTHIHACIYTYTHINTYNMYIHIYTYAYIYTYTYIHMHTNIDIKPWQSPSNGNCQHGPH